jgi:hypothetical protein
MQDDSSFQHLQKIARAWQAGLQDVWVSLCAAGGGGAGVTLESLKWAFAMYMSRAMRVPNAAGEYISAMVPVGDIANHSRSSAASWRLHTEVTRGASKRRRRLLDDSSTTATTAEGPPPSPQLQMRPVLQLLPGRALQAGNKVDIPYGSKSPDCLLMNFGFLDSPLAAGLHVQLCYAPSNSCSWGLHVLPATVLPAGAVGLAPAACERQAAHAGGPVPVFTEALLPPPDHPHAASRELLQELIDIDAVRSPQGEVVLHPQVFLHKPIVGMPPSVPLRRGMLHLSALLGVDHALLACALCAAVKPLHLLCDSSELRVLSVQVHQRSGPEQGGTSPKSAAPVLGGPIGLSVTVLSGGVEHIWHSAQQVAWHRDVVLVGLLLVDELASLLTSMQRAEWVTGDVSAAEGLLQTAASVSPASRQVRREHASLLQSWAQQRVQALQVCVDQLRSALRPGVPRLPHASRCTADAAAGASAS